MAKSSALGLAVLCMVLVLSPIPVRSNSRKEIILFAEFTNPGPGPRANTVVVACPGPGPCPNDGRFGQVSVVDAPLRERIETDSPVVGSLQGLAAISSLNGDQLYVSESANIERGKYKVGTLQLQGTLKYEHSRVTGELGVGSGTVSYRFVNGYAEVQTVREFAETRIVMLKIVVKEIDD